MKRRLIGRVIGVLVFCILLILAPPAQRFDFLVLIAVTCLVFRMLRPCSVSCGFWRLLIGLPVFLLTRVISALLLVADQEAGAMWSHPLGMVLSLLTSLGLAWSIVAIYRLCRWNQRGRGRRALIPGGLLLLLGILDADMNYALVVSLWLVLWGISWEWMGSLGRGRRWKWLLLFVLGPLGMLFSAHGTGESGDIDLVVANALALSGVYGALRTFLVVYWISFPLRVIGRGMRHLVLGFSIRVRLGLTYFFSTIVPALLAVALMAVVIFVGIGSLKAQATRNLVRNDLRAMEVALQDRRSFADPDSIGEGLYLRLPSDPGLGLDGRIDSLLAQEDGMVRWGPALTEAAGGVDSSWSGGAELWIKVGQRSRWELPDSLLPFHKWSREKSLVSGVLPIGGGRAAFIAAQPVVGDQYFMRVLLRVFNRPVLERYKKIIGSGLMVHPTQTMTITVRGAGQEEMPLGSDDDTTSAMDHYWQADQISTVSEHTGKGLLYLPLHHGICELRDSAAMSGTRRNVRGIIVVRTSIADLASSLYSTRGMNIVAVVVVAVLAGLILVAVMISTFLGFSLNSSITSAVGALRRGAEQLGRGDLDARIELESRDELGKLAAGFNDMAADLKLMIEKVAEKERLDREIQIARQIQVNLFPGELPQVEGFDIAAASVPALEVGGDYYDALIMEPKRLVLVVADVSGKGVAAAMLMSNLQAALHVLLSQKLPLDRITDRLNRMVYRSSTPEMFITFFIAVVDTSKGIIEYVNAGHDHPLILRGNTTVELESGGIVLGVFPDNTYPLVRQELQPGDTLALYSDGITEAMNEAEEEFGKDGLAEALHDLSKSNAEEILRGIFQRVRAHTGAGRRQMDDLTFLVVRVGQFPRE